MLKKIHPLPGTQPQSPVNQRNRQRYRHHRRLDMGGHIIRALISMSEIGHFRVRRGRHESVEKGLQVGLYLGVRVFLNEQAGGGVADKEREQARAVGKRAGFIGEFVKAGAIGLDGEGLHGLA